MLIAHTSDPKRIVEILYKSYFVTAELVESLGTDEANKLNTIIERFHGKSPVYKSGEDIVAIHAEVVPLREVIEDSISKLLYWKENNCNLVINRDLWPVVNEKILSLLNVLSGTYFLEEEMGFPVLSKLMIPVSGFCGFSALDWEPAGTVRKMTKIIKISDQKEKFGLSPESFEEMMAALNERPVEGTVAHQFRMFVTDGKNSESVQKMADLLKVSVGNLVDFGSRRPANDRISQEVVILVNKPKE